MTSSPRRTTADDWTWEFIHLSPPTPRPPPVPPTPWKGRGKGGVEGRGTRLERESTTTPLVTHRRPHGPSRTPRLVVLLVVVIVIIVVRVSSPTPRVCTIDVRSEETVGLLPFVCDVCILFVSNKIKMEGGGRGMRARERGGGDGESGTRREK